MDDRIQPQQKMALAEDDLNGRRYHRRQAEWMMASTVDGLKGRWQAALTEDGLNGTWPQWPQLKTVSVEDGLNRKCLNGRQSQGKTSTMERKEDNHNPHTFHCDNRICISLSIETFLFQHRSRCSSFSLAIEGPGCDSVLPQF